MVPDTVTVTDTVIRYQYLNGLTLLVALDSHLEVAEMLHDHGRAKQINGEPNR